MDTSSGRSARGPLIAGILHFLAGQDPRLLADVRAALESEIDRSGGEALNALGAHLFADHGWDYHPPDPLVRRLHHLLADRFLEPGSRLLGAEHLAALEGAPVIIFANHISYADANAIEVLLHRAGSPLAGRLTALAGPKVFTDRKRRFSSLCFGTIKVPQSADVSSEEAVLNPRDVARAARRAIDAAHARLRDGDTLLLFGEGTRSRTAQMQPMLAAVARYLEGPDAWILPAGLTGSEALFPVGSTTIATARIELRLGAPIRSDVLRSRAAADRRVAMDTIGLAIAELLPAKYQGVYGRPGASA